MGEGRGEGTSHTLKRINYDDQVDPWYLSAHVNSILSPNQPTNQQTTHGMWGMFYGLNNVAVAVVNFDFCISGLPPSALARSE